MAKIGEQKLSERSATDIPTAMQLFTDREEPQEAFERKLKVVSENLRDGSAVIVYYGVGGIGKTTLKIRLQHLLDGDNQDIKWRLGNKIDAYHVGFDFDKDKEDITHDKRTILIRLRNQIKKLDKNYNFYLFDTALLRYADKTGVDIEKDGGYKGIIESNDVLNKIFKYGGYVPVLSSLFGSIQQVDSLAKDIRNEVGDATDKYKFSDEIEIIRSKQADEILESLPNYFIKDMARSMAKVDRPLVVFLDTYEKYVDSLNNELATNIDDWLWRGDQSLIKSIPGLLWVICGREKIKWAEKDEYWKEDIPDDPTKELTEEEKIEISEQVIEQHCIGDLSFKDTSKYLEKFGIADDTFQEQLYKLTNGTPLYLDMCKQQYFNLPLEKRKDINEYGKDIEELISRYLKTMPEWCEELSKLFAIVGFWTDDEARELINKTECLKYSDNEKYENFKSHSFVIKKEDGRYYLHDTFRDACQARLKNNEDFYQSVKKSQRILYKRKMKDIPEHKHYYLMRLVYSIINIKDYSVDDFKDDWKEIKAILENDIEIGDYSYLYEPLKILYSYVNNFFPKEELLRGEIVFKFANAMYLKGQYKLAYELSKESYELFGPERDERLEPLQLTADCAFKIGSFDAALKMDEFLYAIKKEKFGEEDPRTLDSLHRIATDYGSLNDDKKCFEINKKVYELRKNKLGENHPDTLVSLFNLAGDYNIFGKENESIQMYLEVFEKRKEVLGGSHPGTLTAASKIAYLHRRKERYKEALEIDDGVFDIQSKTLGYYHPDTLKTLYNISTDLYLLKDYKEAYKIRRMVLEKQTKLLGAYHKSTLITYEGIVSIYRKIKEYNDAKELDEDIYQKLKERFGVKDERTLMFKDDLATDYLFLDEYEQALKEHEEIYSIKKDLYGENNLTVINSLKSIIYDYLFMGNIAKTKLLFNEFYKGSKNFYGGIKNEEMIRKASDILDDYFKWNLGYDNLLEEIKSDVLTLDDSELMKHLIIYKIGMVCYIANEYKLALENLNLSLKLCKKLYENDDPSKHKDIEDTIIEKIEEVKEKINDKYVAEA